MSKKKEEAPVKELRDQDLEDLLNQLSTEQLEELHTDLIDPDDSMVPPSDRCRYKTDKLPTGPYQRKLLLEYMARIAKEEKDWEEEKPYTKETRGKIWKAPVEEKIKLDDDEAVSTEWDDVLNSATEAELVDLAAILGFHGMLNQVQYHQAFVEGKDRDESSGFQGVAKCADLKAFEDDPPNDVDVGGAVEKVKANDPDLKELNLNNAEDISVTQLLELAEALEANTHLEKLHMANTFATNKVARTLAASLMENKTLKVLNIESNYIVGAAIADLIEAINKQQVVQELRVANQSQQTLGVRAEMLIAQQMKENTSIIKLGIFPEVKGAKILINRYVERNVDNLRRSRMGKELDLPKEDETPYYLRQLVEQQNAANKKIAEAKKAETKPKAPESKTASPAVTPAKTPAPAATKTPTPGKTASVPPGKTAPVPAKTPAAATPAKTSATTPAKTVDTKTPFKTPVGKEASKSPAVPAKTTAAAPKSPAPIAKTAASATKTTPAAAAAKTPAAVGKTPAAAAKTPVAAKTTPAKTPTVAEKTPAKKPASSSSDSDSSSSDSEDDKKKLSPAKPSPAKTQPAKPAPAAAAKKPPAKKSSSSSSSDSEDDKKKPPVKTPPAKTTPAKISPAKTTPAKKKSSSSSSSSSSDSSSSDDDKKKVATPAKTAAAAPPAKKADPPKKKKVPTATLR